MTEVAGVTGETPLILPPFWNCTQTPQVVQMKHLEDNNPLFSPTWPLCTLFSDSLWSCLFFFSFFFPKSGCVTLLSLSFGSLLNSWTLNKDAACQSKTLSHSLYSHYRWAGIHNRNKNHNRGPVISGTCYENTKKCKKKLLQKQRFLWLVLSYKKKERKKILHENLGWNQSRLCSHETISCESVSAADIVTKRIHSMPSESPPLICITMVGYNEQMSDSFLTMNSVQRRGEGKKKRKRGEGEKNRWTRNGWDVEIVSVQGGGDGLGECASLFSPLSLFLAYMTTARFA